MGRDGLEKWRAVCRRREKKERKAKEKETFHDCD